MKRVAFILFLLASLRAALATITYQGEVFSATTANQNNTAQVWTLTAGIPAGGYAVAYIGLEAPSTQTNSSVADSRGNTWTMRAQRLNNSVHQAAIATAPITTALQSGDTVTVTLSGTNPSSDRAIRIVYFYGVATASQPDATVNNAANSQTVSDSITTGTDGSVIVAIVQSQRTDTGGGSDFYVYSGGNFTDTGSGAQDFGYGATTVGLRSYLLYKITTTHGANAFGGAYNKTASYIAEAVALKPATVNTYYVDFAAGADSNAGTSTGAALKHCPGDTNATSTASSIILAAGDTVIFKGGVTYTGDIAIKQSGSSGLPITYDGTGATWGTGRSLMDCNNTYYHAFSCISPTKNWFTIKGFKITKAKNSNDNTNQTINRAGADITGVNYAGDGDLYSEGGIQLNNCANFYLDDLWIYEFENCYDRAVLNAEGDGDSQTDLNCAIEKSGISILGTANNGTITNCVIWAVGHRCIKFSGADTMLITDCDFGGTAAAGAVSTNMGWFAVGINLSSGGSGQPLKNITVRKTVAHDGWQYQGDESQQRSHSGDWFHMFGDADGTLEPNDDVHDVLFDRVYCYSNHQFANNNGTAYFFLESDVYNVEWRNCLLVNGFSGAIEMRDTSNAVVNATTIITSIDQPILFKAKSSSGFPLKSIYVTNSVFMTQSANSANVAYGTSGSGYDGELVHSDYNSYYTSAHNNRIEWHGTNYTSIATWRTTTGQDAHSIFVDPKLVSIPTGAGWANASSGDYRPDSSQSSPLIGSGLDQSATFTIYRDGTTRSGTWLIGSEPSSAGGGGGAGLKHFPSTIQLYGVQIR